MKLSFLKWIGLFFSLVASVSGLLVLLKNAQSQSLLLILGAVLFLFGSWATAALLDSMVKTKSA